MRPTWGTVGVAGVLGCALGALAVYAMRPAGAPVADARPSEAPRPPGARDFAGRSTTGEAAGASAASGGAAPAPAPAPPQDPEAERAARVRRRIADLDAARNSKDRKAFERALRGLFGEKDPAAHAALRDLVADPSFDFPDGHLAVWFGGSDEIRQSAVPGWAAAARARYVRDARSPGCSWDAGAWLYLVAAQGDAADVQWVAAQYETAPEREGEAIAALGEARPALAREALLREIRREPLRDGLWNAISRLATRAPAEAFAVLHAMVLAGIPQGSAAPGDVLGLWAKSAPADALGEVRARLHAMAAEGRQVRELIAPVQVLANRGQDVSEFADIIASAGRELRRLVDEKQTADGTGPYYAIEYHRVAQTPENLAALEYAIQVLGREETRGCQAILAEARARSEWK